MLMSYINFLRHLQLLIFIFIVKMDTIVNSVEYFKLTVKKWLFLQRVAISINIALSSTEKTKCSTKVLNMHIRNVFVNNFVEDGLQVFFTCSSTYIQN